VIVLKLGGSVITEKDSPETLDGAALDAAADAVAGADAAGDLVVVHGGGSFGHHRAERHGAGTDDGVADAGAVVDVHGAMTTLNRFVLDRLHRRDVPALPVHPLSAGARDAGGDLSLPPGTVETMLGEGFVPVLHGDLLAHAGEGATVVSGDELAVRVAEAVDADRIGLCSTVPGVLDADGAVLPRVDSLDDVAGALGDSDATDVTGGMAAKVRTLLSLSTPAFVFGPEGLSAFLAGESPGTRVGGGGG